MNKVRIHEIESDKDYRLAELEIIDEMYGDEDLNLLKQKIKIVFETLKYINSNFKPLEEIKSQIPSYFYINIPYENEDLKKIYGGTIRTIDYSDSINGYKFYEDLDLCITSRFHGLILKHLKK